MKHIVLFSGGASSYVCAKRVLAKFLAEDVILLFNDTKSEDEDLYRFLNDAEQVLNHEIFRNVDGRDIWQVFRDERFLGNHKVDPCSKILKRRAGDLVIKLYSELEVIIYAGYKWTETHRFDKMRRAMAPYHVEFPLTDRPLLDDCQILDELRRDGIKVPRLYEMGFAHNNCGGFCIKAGISHYVHLFKVWPERYLQFEQKEEEMRQFLGRDDIAVLTDRRGGKKKPMTLRVLRERIERGETLPKHDFGGCGCYLGDSDDE